MADIVISHLNKSYGDRAVFRDLSLTIPSGCVTAVMAPSGGGKTTLLRILMGLEEADSGAVTGLERARFSAVFQEDRLLEGLDPVGNLRLADPALTRQKAVEALAAVGLGETVGQPVRELSGGMKRRVALLRALLADCDLLLLDEPFKGLDEKTLDAVLAYTRRASAGITTLLVTHSLYEAEGLGARILTLPVLTGTPDRAD
ncbi:MAG: ATP-binding cassette domain-containing protein [Clostridia bacterium]|nr:ATP-binding cassette domain-containing protein [Clostridia bacterium]